MRKKMEEDDRKFQIIVLLIKIFILGRKIEEGRITFKKPTKRPNEESADKDGGDASDEKRRKSEPQKANAKMLSFGDDEEE